MKKIYIIRHGETEYNRLNKIQGRVDIELNENGIQQAQELNRYFLNRNISFEKVYSSPLKRALETACIVSGREDITVVPELIEFDFGIYDGMNVDSFLAKNRNWDLRSDEKELPEGMESNSELIQRAGSFLKQLEEDPPETVLIVSHGRTIKALIACMSRWNSEELWKQRFPIGTVLSAEYEEGEYRGFHRISIASE